MGSDLNKEHLHNQLISAVYGNVTRDLPDNPVASWVSANDKPAAAPKPATGDAADQQLKWEVMQLPARDRRRLKDVPAVSNGLSNKLCNMCLAHGFLERGGGHICQQFSGTTPGKTV